MEILLLRQRKLSNGTFHDVDWFIRPLDCPIDTRPRSSNIVQYLSEIFDTKGVLNVSNTYIYTFTFIPSTPSLINKRYYHELAILSSSSSSSPVQVHLRAVSNRYIFRSFNHMKSLCFYFIFILLVLQSIDSPSRPARPQHFAISQNPWIQELRSAHNRRERWNGRVMTKKREGRGAEN